MEEFQRDCRQGCLLLLQGLGEMLGGHLQAVVRRQRSNLFEVEEQQNSVSKKSPVSPLAWHCEETPPGQRGAQPHAPSLCLGPTLRAPGTIQPSGWGVAIH